METKTHRDYRGAGAPIWGIFILLIGIVLLLQNFGVLPWDLWLTLAGYWPAIIIVIGLAILLRHTSIWLVSLLTFIILGGSIGLAVWQHGITQSEIGTRNYSEPLANLESAQVNINFTAGRLNMGSLSSDSEFLFEAEAQTRNDVSSMNEEFSKEDNTGQVTLNSVNQQYWPTGGISWHVNLTTQIPLFLEAKSTASTNTFDLEGLELSSFNLNTDASSSRITFPDPSGVLPVTINANAATIEINFPGGAAIRVHATTNIGSFNINSRFTKEGDYYYTQNYDGASDRIDLDISSNVSSIKVN